MREIKFRAWDEECKKMYNNDFAVGTDNFPHTECDIDIFYPSNKNIIIMQYTGLKDKNGKEIYEGDIVETFNTNKNKEVAGIWKVVFTKHLACFDAKRLSNRERDSGEDFECIGCITDYDCKVLGNIYENPELCVFAKGDANEVGDEK